MNDDGREEWAKCLTPEFHTALPFFCFRQITCKIFGKKDDVTGDGYTVDKARTRRSEGRTRTEGRTHDVFARVLRGLGCRCRAID